MNKLSITIDVSKINKAKIVERKYLNKDQQEVVSKEYKMEVIALKEPKKVSEGADWVMNKTHFVVEGQTKEERIAKAPAVYIGEGFEFADKPAPTSDTIEYPEEEVNVDDIPF